MARQARQIGRVQPRFRYSNALTPQNTVIVVARAAASRPVRRLRRPARVFTAAGVEQRRVDQEAHDLPMNPNASRVSSAMMVICGLTPSALGTGEPSAT
ncbi:MAG TPA: hypothetical protein VNR66_13055 [Solirubrobacteraceae bacterium]|nr:hypothetical protein [Solirubrobacteraceae bacterium]